MRQLNNLKFMAMAMFVALMSLSFTACSDDDEDNGPDTNSIVGVWENGDYYIEDNYGRDQLGTLRIQFNSNKTGVMTFIFNNSSISPSEYPFEYSFVNDGSDKTVTFKWTSINKGGGIFYDSEYDIVIMPSSLTIGNVTFARK